MNSLSIQENVPLAPLTTLKVGGPARRFVEAATEQEIVDAISLAEALDVPVFILGGGSNIVVSDSGFDGLVSKIAIKGIEFNNVRDGKVRCIAGAGENWDDLVAECVSRNLAGVECLSGIPGLVGGTPIQNVGAYGQDVSETIVAVRCFDRRSGEILTISTEECEFSYRKSRFNSRDIDRFVVLSVEYELTENGEPKLTYSDLKEHFGRQIPTLAKVREAVLAIRRSKSMVIDDKDVNSQSAGSFFKNPILSKEKFAVLAASNADIPSFPAGDDSMKVPAAWLIERSGITKGTRLGKAGTSTNHSLAIVNFGGASANDILTVKDEIQRRVREKFGIELDPEPIFIGF
ncbi:MAG TPA: UDP-N-acetylmuramate dehydrogenase [Pyrinomonadaceae bacterium]|nr:UDP-N-acetylmuramate dehydrogenase [Pyrinomonadaceae bacterium]